MHQPANDKILMSQVEFYLDDFACTLQIEEDSLHFKCTKAWKLCPLTSFDKTIQLVNVISTSFETDYWKVNDNDEPLLNAGWLNSMKSSEASCYCLVINTWKKTSKRHRRLQTIKLRTFERKHCVRWHKLINAELKKSLAKYKFARPHNLLVLVNPFAGLKKGKFVYHKIMSPLFDLVNIERDVVVTQYQNHAKEYLESTDLSKYDGVIAVGGDQTFSEVLNGTLVAHQRRCDVSLKGEGGLLNSPVKYDKPPMRIGHVPAGSGNASLYTIQGVCDPETSTLQIICGESHPMDISSTHDDEGNLIMFSAYCTTFGLVSDILHISHSFRFLGPIRYSLVPLKVFWDFKSHPAEIAFLPYVSDNKEDIPKTSLKCRYPCSVCLDESVFEARRKISFSPTTLNEKLPMTSKTVDHQIRAPSSANGINHLPRFDDEKAKVKNGTCLEPEIMSSTSNKDLQADSKLNFMTSYEETNSACYCTEVSEGHGSLKNWKVIRGRFIVVSSLNNSNACEQVPTGFDPICHLADGKLILKLIYSKRWEYLKHLRSVRAENEETTKMSTVKRFEAQGFHFRKVPDATLKTNRKHRDYAASSDKSVTGALDEKHSSQTLNRGIFTCDGEEMDKDVLTVWIHKGLIDVFARGIED